MSANPRYAAAPYELKFANLEGRVFGIDWPLRFEEPPPKTVRESSDREVLSKWFCEHSIPPFLADDMSSIGNVARDAQKLAPYLDALGMKKP